MRKKRWMSYRTKQPENGQVRQNTAAQKQDRVTIRSNTGANWRLHPGDNRQTKLKGLPFETADRERSRSREGSVEEALPKCISPAFPSGMWRIFRKPFGRGDIGFHWRPFDSEVPCVHGQRHNRNPFEKRLCVSLSMGQHLFQVHGSQSVWKRRHSGRKLLQRKRVPTRSSKEAAEGTKGDAKGLKSALFAPKYGFDGGKLPAGDKRLRVCNAVAKVFL